MSLTSITYALVFTTVQVIKKNVLQMRGKVTCRNVKTECPLVECDNPIMPPDQCCKHCPGQGGCMLPMTVKVRGTMPMATRTRWVQGENATLPMTVKLRGDHANGH